MTKYFTCFALLGILSLASCKNTPNPQKTGTPADKEETPKSGPDPNDLLRAMQGRWQSEQDASYVLEIADTQMRHFNGGNLTQQSNLEVDGACKSNICTQDSADTSDGWCFMETFIQDGKYAFSCHFVVRCDTTQFHYRDLGAAGGGLVFKKIE